MAHFGRIVGVCLVLAVGYAVAITQQDIDDAANMLKVTVYLETQHEVHTVGFDHDVNFVFENAGNKKILGVDGWKILFQMKTRLTTLFNGNGLELIPAEGCLYALLPTPGQFAGLNPGEKVVVRVVAEGLSISRYGMFPRMSIYTETALPRTIVSTDDDDVKYVHLAPVNSTLSDLSRMTPVRRTMTEPEVEDLGKVPPSIVMPAPLEIVMQSFNLIRMNVSRWNIWPMSTVDQDVIKEFKDTLGAVPGIGEVRIVNGRVDPENMVFLQHNPGLAGSDDAYNLASTVAGNNRGASLQVEAKTGNGFHNALQSLRGIVGLYDIMPEIRIRDDARFGIRSVSIDVTKNFHPVATIIKLIDFMSMYKLNDLVINLGDDYGWRLEIPQSYDFSELHLHSSKRCIDQGQCLPPALGSGADSSSSGSGYYTKVEFVRILQHARENKINVVPKINLLGSVRSATIASEVRYDRLKTTNMAKAHALHLNMEQLQQVPADVDTKSCYTDGVLNPCLAQTDLFMDVIIQTLNELYQLSGVQLTDFHAGGSKANTYWAYFPSCSGKTQGQLMREMITKLQVKFSPLGTRIRVHDDAMLDPVSGTCLTNQPAIDQSRVIIDFREISPLTRFVYTPAQWAFLERDLPPPPPANATGPHVPDFFLNYQGPKAGLAPWAVAYDCANSGYKVLLAPASFLDLSSPQELDFNEPGDHHDDHFHVVDVYKMMMFEPFNLHSNMDTGPDGWRYLPYRLCKIYDCVTLTAVGRQNILGLQATIDTAVIRNADQLWYMTGMRLPMFAERAWRSGHFEDMLKAEDPNTLVDMERNAFRAGNLTLDMTVFLNNFGYKEAGRLDAMGIKYRIPAPGASIMFGVTFGQLPPYPAVLKTYFLGLDFQYRELHRPNPTWRKLFTRDPQTGWIKGGYNFTFPDSNQVIELRSMTPDGLRFSKPTRLVASAYNLLPRGIPWYFRGSTCLPIKQAELTQLENVKAAQFNQILTNIPLVQQDEIQFGERKVQNLTNALSRFYRGRPPMALPAVFAGIHQQLSALPETALRNVTTGLPRDPIDFLQGVHQYIARMDKTINEGRARSLEVRMDRMELAYQRCIQGGGAARGRVIASPSRRQG